MTEGPEGAPQSDVPPSVPRKKDAATFELRAGTRYARVVVTDENGHVAWSNPIFVTE